MKAALKNAKRNCERKLAKESKKNRQSFCSYKKKKRSNMLSLGHLKDDNNKIETDSIEQANILNNCYCSVSTRREDTSNVPEPVDVLEGSEKEVDGSEP